MHQFLSILRSVIFKQLRVKVQLLTWGDLEVAQDPRLVISIKVNILIKDHIQKIKEVNRKNRIPERDHDPGKFLCDLEKDVAQ